jgi:uncharacterized membrane protein
MVTKKIGKGFITIKGVGEEILGNLVNPLIPKFNLADVLQIVVGASILAVPVGFTEETWRLGESLPMKNILFLMALSVFFIALFTQFQYHKKGLKSNWGVFSRRVFFTYVFSFLAVALIMTTIQRAPWQLDWILAFKRVVIVTFPSSLSAAIADTLR